MASWLWWLIAAGVLAIAETVSLDLVLVMFAGGAAGAAVAAAAGAPAPIQVIVFAIASLALLAAVRPVIRRHMIASVPHSKTGVERLIGREAVVVEPVDARSGRVKIGGDTWSATSYDTSQRLEIGSVAKVMEIKGATAVVWSDI
ncbi:MAG: NfeD family protein [Mycobacteriales bacterium]